MSFIYKKSLGQNFLNDKRVISDIMNLSLIDSDTLVIEVGCGMGAISLDIVKRCGYAYLFEIDDRLEGYLNDKLKNYNNYTLYIKDFLKSSYDDISSKVSLYSKLYVVGNLPYYITTPIVIKLVSDFKPDKMVLMVQKEVGIRLCSKAGSSDYGAISVLLGYYYDINKGIDVSRYCFNPMPMVDSMVIVLDKKELVDNNIDYYFFSNFVKDAFHFKRKNLRNNLKSYDLDIISKVLSTYNLNLSNRAEDLSLEVFIDLVNNLCK